MYIASPHGVLRHGIWRYRWSRHKLYPIGVWIEQHTDTGVDNACFRLVCLALRADQHFPRSARQEIHGEPWDYVLWHSDVIANRFLQLLWDVAFLYLLRYRKRYRASFREPIDAGRILS